MKKGSGDDPFADLEEEHESDDTDAETAGDTAAESPSTDADASGDESASSASTGGTDSGAAPPGSGTEDGASVDSSEDAGSSTVSRYTDSPDGGSTSDDPGTAGNGPKQAGSSGSSDEQSTVTGEKADTTGTDPSTSASASGQTKAEADGIPWVLRRSRVKEDRENVHQFFLREEYSTREDEIIESVASELDMRQKDLQKLDVREAMVASADPEAIAEVLREWGYEYLK